MQKNYKLCQIEPLLIIDKTRASTNMLIEEAISINAYNTIYNVLSSFADKMMTSLRKEYESKAEDVTLKFKPVVLYCLVANSLEKGEVITGPNMSPVFMYLTNNFVTNDSDMAKLSPELSLFYDDNASYAAASVGRFLEAFDYKRDGYEIPSIASGENGKIIKKALKTLVIDEWSEIIKSVMGYYGDSCQKLKETKNSVRELACQASAYEGDMDFMTKLFVCHQVFNLADNEDFCPALNAVDEGIDSFFNEL